MFSIKGHFDGTAVVFDEPASLAVRELPRLSSGELAEVHARLKELVKSAPAAAQVKPIAGHPALGIWKDRTDLPFTTTSSRLARVRWRLDDRSPSQSEEQPDAPERRIQKFRQRKFNRRPRCRAELKELEMKSAGPPMTMTDRSGADPVKGSGTVVRNG